MKKINLLGTVQKVKRTFDSNWRTEKNRKLAQSFGEEFFDGDRINGYGGYKYDGRWKNVVKKLQEVYGIDSESSILDVGCAKGFLLYDLKTEVSGIDAIGLDISEYSLNHAMEGFGKYISRNKKDNFRKLEEIARKNILPFLIKGSADDLPWPDNSFDVVLSINTLHNLSENKCRKALIEMQRVCRTNKMFVQVDSYETEKEKQKINNWNLTAQTILHVDDWLSLFKEVSYKGDYFWTIFDSEN